jgi:hypothetical protein
MGAQLPVRAIPTQKFEFLIKISRMAAEFMLRNIVTALPYPP